MTQQLPTQSAYDRDLSVPLVHRDVTRAEFRAMARAERWDDRTVDILLGEPSTPKLLISFGKWWLKITDWPKTSPFTR